MHLMSSRLLPYGILVAVAVCIFSVVVVLCNGLVEFHWLYFIGRRILITFLPFVDWTVLNKQNCIVRNPWYLSPPVPVRECHACEDLTSVPELRSTVSATKLYEHFIDTKVPVVLRGGYEDRQVHLEDVIRSIKNNLSAKVCAFRSNSPWSFDQFLEQTSSMDSFYALWENCNEDSKKLARRFYRRPQKLPAAVELTAFSWVMLSRRFTSGKPKIVDFASGSVAVWIQAEGSVQLQLERRKCQCSLQVKLQKGDYLIARMDVWDLSFTPLEADGDSIAFIPTGYLQ